MPEGVLGKWATEEGMVTQYLSVDLSESVYDGKRLRQLSMCG